MADTKPVQTKPVDDAPFDDNDDANRGLVPPAIVSPADETVETFYSGAMPVYPATIEEAQTFCLSGTKDEFPQQIFMANPKFPDDNSKAFSITNCAQLFAALPQTKNPAPQKK